MVRRCATTRNTRGTYPSDKPVKATGLYTELRTGSCISSYRAKEAQALWMKTELALGPRAARKTEDGACGGLAGLGGFHIGGGGVGGVVRGGGEHVG